LTAYPTGSEFPQEGIRRLGKRPTDAHAPMLSNIGEAHHALQSVALMTGVIQQAGLFGRSIIGNQINLWES
jgi:hypothetical protein